MSYSFTSQAARAFAFFLLGVGVIGALIIGFTLTHTEPDLELILTGSTIAGDVVPHPHRWLIALGVLISGVFNSIILFAVSEALCRLQDIEYYAERTSSYTEGIRNKASS
ncbi:hypothetical protein M3936_16425 [Sutcliffiella horikoshii]|nr:hypothetical protein [Sutcliffiella horikoshii]